MAHFNYYKLKNMIKNIDVSNEFFPSSNLNSQFFYFYCPSLPNKEKARICETILQNNGVS